MEIPVYSDLQLREVFHLEFLRWLGRKIKAEYYCLKGGVNLRLFFKSIRYSEDMDLDAGQIKVSALKDAVMEILKGQLFQDSLKPFGIQRIIPPNITKAKQTETTQRFKVHLISYTGEDLFTKIEFSRRGFKGNVVIQPVSDDIVRFYKLSPLLVPHYDALSAISQKINALAARKVTQARDIFDLYILNTQYSLTDRGNIKIERNKLSLAYENLLEVDFAVFRDSVVSYLSSEDQKIYGNARAWEEIRMKTAAVLEQLQNI